MTVPLDVFLEKPNLRVAELEASLSKETELRETAEKALNALQKSEMSRRRKAVREALEARLSEAKEHCGAANEVNCDDLLTDEKIEEYAAMEDHEGNFCGDVQACKDLDARCMSALLAANKAKSRTTYAWEEAHGSATSNDGLADSVGNIMK